ncbi:hypothetical protein CFC21_080556 [Triticum aestivum]|uniref:TF-B3 domain-containing protein n=2 Tax=Triticum aestivum TaxID=4565 RepID=A0A3B6N130_WHEAT|nr:putative B3 domain-containing protein Os04g0347400 [Triticum aestivum]KAF7075811.1 hypothetical protein CFC21_080556 [Triticum aestivum]
MGSSGNYGMRTKMQQMRINDETARWFDTGDRGAEHKAHIMSPFGKKPWGITVGRDSNGSFLGDGWPQFVAVHGIGVGCYLVFKHVLRGTVTLKVFDDGFVIKPFGLTITVLSPAEIENAFARKPQFIVPFQTSFKEKMPIPPEFLRRGYISEEDLSRPKPAAIFSTSWHVDLEKDGPNVFFAGPLWPKFLEHKNLSETHVLLIKYHGRMTFSLETYGHGNNEHIEEETSSSQQSEQSPGAQSQEEEHVSTPKTPKRKRKDGRKPNNFRAPKQEDKVCL